MQTAEAIATKTCSKCLKAKPLEDFHRDKSKSDGRRAYCKACQRELQREYYAANRDNELERCRAYREANRDNVLERKRAYRAANREKLLERCRAYREANRDKERERHRKYEQRRRRSQKHAERIRARYAVRNSIRSGKLIRQPCIICGSEPAHGHHEDYSKPLDVTWLCEFHHRLWHNVDNELARRSAAFISSSNEKD